MYYSLGEQFYFVLKFKANYSSGPVSAPRATRRLTFCDSAEDGTVGLLYMLAFISHSTLVMYGRSQ